MLYIRYSTLLLILSLLSIKAMAATNENVCSRGLPVEASLCLKNGGLENCRAMLDQNPDDFTLRLAVCDALVSDDNPQGAKGLMESGSRVHRRSSTQDLIRRAIDNIDEYIAFQNRVEVATDPKVFEDQIRFRCLRLRREADCRDLLFMHSEEAEPNIILGDLAFEAERFTEAVSRYLIASETDPDPVQAKLEQALAARNDALTPCFSDTSRNALTVCENNLIQGYTDEGRIRMRIGDVHLLAGRYGDAITSYSHTSAGSDGESRARLTRNIQGCSRDSLPACNRAIDEAGGHSLFRPLMPTAYKNRCLAALNAGIDDRLAEYCENALSEMAAADAIEIRDMLASRSQTPSDPWQEIWQTCSDNADRYGWDTDACRLLADADIDTAPHNQARSELDALSIEACRTALERGDMAAARQICELKSEEAYQATTRISINEMLAVATQTQSAQENKADNPPNPVEAEQLDSAAGRSNVAIAGNDPLDSLVGVFIVTY